MISRHFLTPCLFFISFSLACAQTPTATPTTTGTNAKPAGTPPIVLHLPRLIPVTDGIVVPLWPEGKMPGLGADQPESQTTSGNPSPDGNILLTNVSNPIMTVYKAPGVTGPAPAMIICPGGGYGILSYKVEGTEIAAWLNSLGITGIVLKYRVPKNRDGAFQDIQRAMRLARSNAADWGINPNQLGVIGLSAGGNLAVRLSTNFGTNAYDALDTADKLSCRPDFVILVYPAYLSKGCNLSPDYPVTADTPPTLAVHAADDLPLMIGSIVYIGALEKAGVPCRLLIYKVGGHAFGLHSNLEVRVWPVQAAEWLRKDRHLPLLDPK
ncbi:MAG: alpha/beta hydrolase [Chthoniobacteraceae bacterium]